MKKILIAGIEDRVPHYIATLRAVGLEPVVGLGVDDIAPFAGLLLPGGGDVDPALFGQENHGSRQIERDLDDAQLSLLHRFADAGKPVLGICKGCQVLNVGLGGDMIQDLPNSADHAFDEDFQFHDITCGPGSLLDRLYGPTVRVNSAHHQAVDRLGKGLRATAVSPDGVTEALEHETLPLYGFQFHPERMCFANLRPEAVDGAPIFEFFKTLVEEQP
jgi:putative glutamine amidotransferase